MEMRLGTVVLRPPHDVEQEQPEISVNVISLTEINSPSNNAPISWRLFTSDPVDNIYHAAQVVQWYALRWRIEEFHKFWKSEGMQVEKLRMTTPDNLRRIAILQAFAACRIMRLRDNLVERVSNLKMTQDENTTVESCAFSLSDKATLPLFIESSSEGPCTQILTNEQWQMLWVTMEGSTPPSKVPSKKWAGRAVAKLGGWNNTKQTGRPGYRAFCLGWKNLMTRCDTLAILPLLACKQGAT
jgi:hypothetical protein